MIQRDRDGFPYQGPPWSPPPVSCMLIFGGGTYLRAKTIISGQLFGFSA